MTTKQALEYFGYQASLARSLGVKYQAIQQWGEYPPIGRQYQIEVLTGGALKAERPKVETGAPN